VTEETPGAGNGKSHGPEFTENLMPSFHRHPFFETAESQREYRPGDASVAFEHLFDRGGLIAKDAVTWVQHRAKNLIHGGRKQDAADWVQTGGGTLGSADKVVNKNIDCCELALMGVVQVGVMKQGHGNGGGRE
jgi:hypothetical protein